MILVCYDGSTDAKEAIQQAARLMPGAKATVVTVWESMFDALTYSDAFGIGLSGSAGFGTPSLDDTIQQHARETAAEGAALAVEAGLDAESSIACRRGGRGRTLLTVAAEIDASVVVLGTRGRSDLRSFLLGSTAHEALHYADRPVLIIPSPAVTALRRELTHNAMGIVEGQPPALDSDVQELQGHPT